MDNVTDGSFPILKERGHTLKSNLNLFSTPNQTMQGDHFYGVSPLFSRLKTLLSLRHIVAACSMKVCPLVVCASVC